MKLPGWISRRIHIPPSAKWDAVLLPVLFLFNLFNFSTWHDLVDLTTNPWVLFFWLYGLVGLFPLIWRNRAPMTVFATQWVHAVAAWPFMSKYTPVVGIPVALYAVAFHHRRSVSLLALFASFISSGTTAYAVSFKLPYHANATSMLAAFIPNALFFTIMTIGAWFLGNSRGVSQRHQQHLERKQEITREAETLAAERRKIARELHDIVSHSVTVILLQANGAASIADTDFAQITETQFNQIKQSLTHITTTGTQTMAELRRLLSVLETGDATRDALGTNKLEPQPGLANLAALLRSLRATGMPVAYHVEGAPRDLDLSVDLTAYRIVQEGLTNVLKHAGKDANSQLRLVWNPQRLLIQIDNDTDFEEASRKSALSTGRGLVGLRERVHAVGGNLKAEPYPEGGYRLIASLPFAVPETSIPGTSSQPREGEGKVSV
ncbi:MAG: sensor histidine kinase [Pseudonocardiaceae bacterium]